MISKKKFKEKYKSTGSPGVPLLKVESTNKRRRSESESE